MAEIVEHDTRIWRCWIIMSGGQLKGSVSARSSRRRTDRRAVADYISLFVDMVRGRGRLLSPTARISTTVDSFAFLEALAANEEDITDASIDAQN